MTLKLKSTLLLTACFVAPQAWADVVIDLPRDVQVLVVNGEDAGYSSFGFDYKENLTLQDGLNQVVFRISKVVNESGNKSTKFKSKPLVATFDSSNSQLDLSILNVKTLQEGYDFDSEPEFNLTAKSGSLDYFEKGQLLTLATFGADFVQATANFNKSSEKASVASFSKQKVNPTSDGSKEGNVNLAQSSVDDQLKLLFLNKSAEDKQAFLSWAIQNMN
ncbi:UPF0319 protein VPA1584 precursor [Vibrio ponticus]|nr:UPF0319 protein VPA1584 precursor [Vibrio ponticus]